jgi:hypothetical protein
MHRQSLIHDWLAYIIVHGLTDGISSLLPLMGVATIIGPVHYAVNVSFSIKLVQELLLVPHDGARAAKTAPCDTGPRVLVKLKHQKESYQGACSAEACSAMDSHGLTTGDLSIAKLYEALDHSLAWIGAVWVLHILNPDTHSLKLVMVIHGFI